MKRVILFRHGIAEPHGVKPDADRELVPEGRKKVRQIARTMPEIFPNAAAIISSPLIRCAQTAAILAKAYDLKVEEANVLEPSTTAEAVAQFISHRPEQHLILVGHEPSLSATMLRLTGLGGAARQELRRAGFYLVEIDDSGAGKLEWMVAPRILRRLS